MKRTIIQIVLGIIILVLAFLVGESILQPVRFKKEKDLREAHVIDRLKDIRTSQLAYKSVYGVYTSDFDSLIDFLLNGKLPLVKKTGIVVDSLSEKSEDELLKLGVIKRDTTYIPVLDSLFNNRSDMHIEDIKWIPHTHKKHMFALTAGTIEKTGFIVPVFECSAENKLYLEGLSIQMINNFNKKLKDMEKFTGLKIGSMMEASTDGNWE